MNVFFPPQASIDFDWSLIGENPKQNLGKVFPKNGKYFLTSEQESAGRLPSSHFLPLDCQTHSMSWDKNVFIQSYGQLCINIALNVYKYNIGTDDKSHAAEGEM